LRASREEVQNLLAARSADDVDRAHAIWSKVDAATASASQRLCEQMRLILEPTLATKLKGDFRTGKRINMRKIIPYIASSYRKDKIWLRRKKPSKRQCT
jgi:midasin